MPDIETQCVQCKEMFLFSEKEQEMFYQRNMMAPQRCQACRSKKTSTPADEKERFAIVCDHCGRRDQVPFRPKVGRPVLCKECHGAARSRVRIA